MNKKTKRHIENFESLNGGIVLYLPFNGNANDESGNEHTTVVNGATLTTDRFGNANKAYRFASPSHIKVKTSSLLEIGTNDYTITAWVKADQLGGAMRILSHGSWNCLDAGYMMRIHTDHKLLQHFACSFDPCIHETHLGNSNLNIGLWYFVAGTVKRGFGMSLYINGALDSFVANANSCDITTSDDILIGYGDSQNVEQFFGSIDEVRVYNRTLSDLEIMNLAQDSSDFSLAPTNLPTQIPTFLPTYTPEPLTDKLYAVFSVEVYNKDEDDQVLFEANGYSKRVPKGWGILCDSNDLNVIGEGFYAKAYNSSLLNKVVVTFRGSDNLFTVEGLWDWFDDNPKLSIGLVPAQYAFSTQFIDQLKDKYHLNMNDVSFTGHSLGGFLAQLATATYNRPAVVFDSPGAKRVIDDPDHNFDYKSQDIKYLIQCYNAAPDLVNVASGDHFEHVTRLFPKYNPSSLLFTLQQHNMNNLLIQFNEYGFPNISADMTNYWENNLDGNNNERNWPYFEASISWFDTSLRINNYLNNVFFKNYNQNPYYWELIWNTSPNIDSLIFPSTANRKFLISKVLGGTTDGYELYIRGITIVGDNSGNKFFGGTNYKDTMSGGNGDDEYWPFSGMDVITDSGGSNTYYFYTHNMRGTTQINDQDKIGSIKFVNIGCSIGKIYSVDEGASDIFSFFPVFDNACDLKKYSSGVIGPLFNDNPINHKNDIILFKYSSSDLIISYNNNDFSDANRDKISITDFTEGDFNIYTNSNAQNDNTYVAVGGDYNDQFMCNESQDSILAGLSGTNTYFIPLQNQFSCSIISNDDSSNVYRFKSSNVERLLSEKTESERLLNTIGSINIFGSKNKDIIDLSDVGLNDLSSLSYQKSLNGTTLELPGGLSINLDNTDTFLITDGDGIAFYNSSSKSYTTNLTDIGINTTQINNVLSSAPEIYSITYPPTLTPLVEPSDQPSTDPTTQPSIQPSVRPSDQPSIQPTAQPSIHPSNNSTTENNQEDQLQENVDMELLAIAIAGIAILGVTSYSVYARYHNMWPFGDEVNLAKIFVSGDDVEIN